jgi:hypothetical protein
LRERLATAASKIKKKEATTMPEVYMSMAPRHAAPPRRYNEKQRESDTANRARYEAVPPEKLFGRNLDSPLQQEVARLCPLLYDELRQRYYEDIGVEKRTGNIIPPAAAPKAPAVAPTASAPKAELTPLENIDRVTAEMRAEWERENKASTAAFIASKMPKPAPLEPTVADLGKLFGRGSDGAAANRLAMSNPAEYRRLRAQAVKHKLI